MKFKYDELKLKKVEYIKYSEYLNIKPNPKHIEQFRDLMIESIQDEIVKISSKPGSKSRLDYLVKEINLLKNI